MKIKTRYTSFLLIIFGLISGVAFAQPQANFTADETKICGSGTVTFTNQSISAQNYTWDFGNGQTSNLKDPIVFYDKPGTYTVTLTATSGGGSDTETKQGFITVFNVATVDFEADNTAGCTPFMVNFTDLSTPGDKPITKWTWDFGDGNQSNDQNPTHTYTQAGDFQVSLTVVDENGCISKKVVNPYISVESSPTAAFTGSPKQACTAPLTVNFNNTSTTGTGVTYLWDFGDGSTSTETSPSHTYTGQGDYDVTLVVESQNGCTDTLTQKALVNINTFEAGFSSNITAGCFPLTVSFTDTSGSSKRTWNFGNGDSSTGSEDSTTYNTPGTYTVTLIAGSGAGCNDTITQTITVYDSPSIDFTVDDDSACMAPFLVNFSDSTNAAVAWEWELGDGSKSTSQNPSHTYTQPGTYDVQLIVTDTNGCIDTLEKTNYIHIVEPTAKFSPIDNATGIIKADCLPFDVEFEDESKAPIDSIVKWEWDFGNGKTSTEQDPTSTFGDGPPVDTGMFNVTLNIETSEGCTSTAQGIVQTGIKPVPNFNLTPPVGCHPLMVQFADSSSSYANGWFWDFGDGGTSTEQHPSHLYQDTGHFTVTLVVSHNGCPDTISFPDTVHVLPPKPIFEGSPLIGCYTPHEVQFTDLSKGAEKWTWHFGDGNSISLPAIGLPGNTPIPLTDSLNSGTYQNPKHKYMDPGFYTVKLVVENSNGCIDSLILNQYVKISERSVNFAPSSLKGCQPFEVQFFDSSVVNTSIVNWEWDFGDGYVISGGGQFDSVPRGANDSLTYGYHGLPKHVYQDSGLYDVTLIITDQLGCKDTLEIKDLIDTKALPGPGFFADTTTGCTPLTVQFTDTSEGAAPLVAWSWNFGDGSPADTNENPVHVYTTPGKYSVTLEVTDTEGCVKTLTKPNYIQPTYPFTDFTFNSPICGNQAVAFNNTSKGESLKFEWDFGDGTATSTEQSPTHTYVVNVDTTFDVTLTAVDKNGCDSLITKQVKISKPVADFHVDEAISDCPPFVVTFNDSSSSDVAKYQWNFGDPGTGSSNTSTQQNPIHTFENAGKYDIELIVTNTIGCKDTLFIPELIIVGGPYAEFSYGPTTGCAPLTVTFEVDTFNNVDIFQWVFGDGSSVSVDSNTTTVTHTFTEAGSYTPALVVYDPLDTSIGDTLRCKDDGQRNVTVPIVIPGPNIKFTSDITAACAPPATIQFTNQTNEPNATYRWEFGDGNTSTLEHPKHTYDEAGEYNVTLEVTSVQGTDTCVFTKTDSSYINITDDSPFDITVIGDSACPPVIVDFEVVDSTLGDRKILFYQFWEFGDGSIDSIANPSHEYTKSGNYNVVLNAVLTNGCEVKSSVLPVTVHPVPNASFSAHPLLDGVNIIGYDFTNTSTGAVKYEWDLGDGSQALTKDIKGHLYPLENQYIVELTAINQFGCFDIYSDTVDVKFVIEVTNVFTPNGDGKNDFFDLGIPGELCSFDLWVYDRWGLLKYKDECYENDWDGTDMKGRKLNTDTYYYILNYRDQVAWSGWVYVINEP